MTDDRRERRSEVAIVILVAAAHFWGHFYTLAIPSALPLIRAEFGASNVSMGMVMAAFALMAVTWQLPMGVFTDRHGARAFIIGGLALESLAMFSQSLAPSVIVMVGIALIAGIADSVFHPADYTMLTAKIRPSWLGRAYAVHTFSGFLGFALAPTLMTFLLSHGSWRWVLAALGLAGMATAAVLLACRGLLAGVNYLPKRTAGATPDAGALRFLLSAPLLFMFAFYVVVTLATNGLQNFGNSALIELYNVDLVLANTAFAAFLWGTAVGVLGGGVVADRTNRFEAVVAVCYLIAAGLLCAIGIGVLAFGAVIGALFFVGFMIGVVMPSRDLMVRTATPPGAIGKAFGFVSSGFGVGGVIGPLVYGTFMDLRLPQILFYAGASLMISAIAIAILASWMARRAAEAGIAVQAVK
jgi:FSR family fosmidomycin resistance protein-like MFS transporter